MKGVSELEVREPVTLAAGSHSSPDDGVCVVELASLMAGEPFSDSPACVDPVIASFLRTWNDRAAHAARQDLRPYAERIIGSRGSARLVRARRDLCLEWSGAKLRGPRPVKAVTRFAWRLRIAVFCGVGAAVRPAPGAAEYAARLAFARGDAKAALELLDEMLALGPGEPSAPPAPSASAAGPRTRAAREACSDGAAGAGRRRGSRARSRRARSSASPARQGR